ncbi:uncharacterized protein LOC128333096 isoform X2 [Hemicordylus capensis]|uniref:uncharacterized protein LOC128333096 isoform X2 n=1 Tax=Hemicordylus capensis TaxID=884348 RepID=UPI002303C06E|nr:uncharacterized protein LOC128333096 isoform X2 [Hemicordylus capensis]
MQLLNTGGGQVDTKGISGASATHHGIRYKFYATNFSCAGIIILFSSYISAFWILVHGPDFRINIGLWSICQKRVVLTCQPHEVLSTVMLVTRFLMTFSTIFGLIAATFSLLTNSLMRTSRWPFIANGCTALTLMGTMMFFGSSFSPQYLYGQPAPDPRLPITSAWGIYTGYLACLLFSMSEETTKSSPWLGTGGKAKRWDGERMDGVGHL